MMKKLTLKTVTKAKWLKGTLMLIAMALLLNGCQEMENETENDLLFLKSAETVEVAGDVFLSPKQFIRGNGQPVMESLTLDENAVENFAPDFMLYLKNGDEEGNRVSSAIVKLDGKRLFGPSDFSKKINQLSVQVSGISSESVLEVEVRGEPGGFVEVWIEGTLLEVGKPYKMYITSFLGEVYGVNDDDTKSLLYQHDGRMSSIREHNQKLYVQTHSNSLDEWNIHVLDLEGNLLEIPELPEEVTWSVDFTILPDGKFAVYNNDADVVYFLNADFSYQTKVDVDKNGSSWQVMKGIVVGNDLIICENGFRKLLKIDLSTYEVSEFRDFSHLDEPLLNTVSYSDGVFYLGGRYNIYSFEEREPEELFVTLPTFYSDIEIVGNYAYVASYNGSNIYKIDLTDGTYSEYLTVSLPRDIEIVK